MLNLKKSVNFTMRNKLFFLPLRLQQKIDILFYGVMVTRQILVLKFKVRVLVEQQSKTLIIRIYVIGVFLFNIPQ